MAISNCFFTPISKNPRGFSVWWGLQNHATTHGIDHWKQYENQKY